MIAAPSNLLRVPWARAPERWPRPVVPVKCPKCGRWRAPTTNMASPGGRFKSTGRVFTKSGWNFVKDDGTCQPCDCDNPPGSGRNTSACSNCPGGEGPASVLVSFIGQTFFTCQQFCGPSSSPTTLDVTVPDYCAPMGYYPPDGACIGVFGDTVSSGLLKAYFATDTSCSGAHTDYPVFLSGRVELFGTGWYVVLFANVPNLGMHIKIFESPITTAANCTDSAILSSTGFATAMCGTGVPINDQFDAGGSALVTPQYHLC